MRLLHSIAVQERNVSADSIQVDDLPVNPLSAILIAIRPLNDTGTLGNYARYMELVGALNTITVLHRGSAVFRMSGRDAAALNYFRHGLLPKEMNADDTNDERRCVVLPILLGRFAYDASSCLPASRRGELTLELDIDIADTGYNTFNFSVETIELLDAKPREFERKVSIARTIAATGENSIELPLGNTIRGLLAFGTTEFTGASPAPTLGRLGIRVDNEEHSYSSTDVEVAQMLGALMGRQPPTLDLHTHRVDADGGTATEETTGPIEQSMGGWEDYAFLDVDPTRDDTFSIDASKASSVQLTLNAEAANAMRVIPIERMSISSLS